MARFTDKMFLIFGGARGLGGAQARGLADQAGRMVWPTTPGVYTPVPLLDTDAAQFERHTRVNQLGTKEAIGGLVLFLLSDQSLCMTGPEVAMDGGASL